MAQHASRTRHQARRALVTRLLAWFSSQARDLPWRRSRDPYALWVTEIMLQQTQVKTVLPYWERWMKELPTIEKVARATPARLHKLWEGLGYYTRVRNLQKAACQIIRHHEGRFPKEFDEILALPGIGRYTAGAIASIAFNQPRPILDGNVIRVLTRTFGIPGNPRQKKIAARLWRLADELVHDASHISHHPSACSHFNQSLMELGALVCTPRSPNCSVCAVRKLCVARKHNRQERLPNLGPRVKTTARHFIAFIVERNGRFLVRQRPDGVVNAQLWEFPNVELETRRKGLQQVRTAALRLQLKLATPRPVHTVKHTITRFRILLQAFRAEAVNPRSDPGFRWLTRTQLGKLAWTSAHRKTLQAVMANPGSRKGHPSKCSGR